MAGTKMGGVPLIVIMAAMALWAGSGVAQPSLSSGCTSVLISLSPCLDYITGNSTTPSSSCCSQFANVVRSQPQCLCDVINGGAASSIGVNINQTQAMSLPAACNVQTPPVSRCNGGSSPTASPGGTAATSSGGGSKNLPSPDFETSTGNGNNLKFSLFLFFTVIIAYASIYTTF